MLVQAAQRVVDSGRLRRRAGLARRGGAGRRRGAAGAAIIHPAE